MVNPVRRLSFVRWRRVQFSTSIGSRLGYSCFLSPWFFAYAQGVSKADAWVNGLAISLISITAILAFSEWEAGSFSSWGYG